MKEEINIDYVTLPPFVCQNNILILFLNLPIRAKLITKKEAFYLSNICHILKLPTSNRQNRGTWTVFPDSSDFWARKLRSTDINKN